MRPYLVVGENTVKFCTKNPSQLAKTPVTVEYTWQEGPEWDKSEVKKAVQTVKDAASSEWKIKVSGEKIPRMNTLKISANSDK